MRNRSWLNAATFILFFTIMAISCSGAEKEISFKTEDGWTIYGMLGMPEGAKERVPAVVFLHSFDHDRDAYGKYLYPGLAQIISERGMATLRIDLRGRGRSREDRDLHSFSPQEIAKLYLDVRGALAFLESQTGVDVSRIGIVAEGESAEAAVKGWAGDSRVRAVVLISGRLSEEAKQQISANPKTPFFLIVSREDRAGFRDMADAYKLTQSEDSLINVYKDMGMGTTMFSVWRSEHAKEKPIEENLAGWMLEQLHSAGRSQEVSFQTEDGWTLYGTLRTPDGTTGNAPPPGVIMVHSSFTHRHIFDHLAEQMVKRWLVVLNFDTRGRGKSTGKGELLSLPAEERNKTALDAKAAVNFLASQQGVKRVGLLGPDRGAVYALAAAIDDPRVGALLLMTTLINATQKEQIAKLDIPIFYVASKDIEAVTNGSMAEAYAVTKNRGSRLLVYNGGALGYDIFQMDENLEPTLAQWTKEQLSR
jgi:dienelactone hydrolase